MSQKTNKDINLIIRPYTFVLQEGKSIKNNYLDYSLRLLLGRPQLIAKPSSSRKKKRVYRSR